MSRVIIGHFGDESLQSITCTESDTDKPEQPRDRTRTKHKPMRAHKMAIT